MSLILFKTTPVNVLKPVAKHRRARWICQMYAGHFLSGTTFDDQNRKLSTLSDRRTHNLQHFGTRDHCVRTTVDKMQTDKNILVTAVVLQNNLKNKFIRIRFVAGGRSVNSCDTGKITMV
jgi:hypothetical protein